MRRFAEGGDRSAFEELVARWDRRILSFLAKSCGDLDAAQDLRQEVFIRVYRHGRGFDHRYEFSSWLFKIAVNVVRSRHSGRRREHLMNTEEESLLDEAADDGPNPQEAALKAETAGRVRSELARLEPEQRSLLLLRFDLGHNYREIADIVGAPESTVKSRIYALLVQLKGRLRDERVAERAGEK